MLETCALTVVYTRRWKKKCKYELKINEQLLKFPASKSDMRHNMIQVLSGSN